MIRALLRLVVLACPAAVQTVSEAPGEARIRALALTLRCPVCHSESIPESRSSTAAEMMVMIREMVAEGRTDAAITGFFRTPAATS